MKILFASAEAYPLAKVGGLGDVAGSLPKALRALGHDVRIVMPRYGSIQGNPEEVARFPVQLGKERPEAGLRVTRIGDVPVYLIDKPDLFDRPKVYEYDDDGRRFGFFCKAVLDVLPAADFWPDLIHVNDWHSALVPAFLESTYAHDPKFAKIGTVLTIHNLLHQGLFPRELFDWLGLPGGLWTPDGVEFYGKLNFLKAGIVFADLVNTVSPTYAKEIQTKEFGEGLDGLLRSRAAKLSGILNGIDYEVWNPAKDPFLAQKYSKSTVERKRANTAALQKEAGLPAEAKAPLIGFIGRITGQKGFDILLVAFPRLLEAEIQFVLLGTGEKKYEDPIAALARTRSDVVVWLKYDEALAHRIYAGSDFFLMPSKFEPCGLGQMISLRYGTIPIVRSTGGLADTVADVTDNPSNGNGFAFRDYLPAALVDAVQRAVAFYRAGRGWKSLAQRAMATDLSWKALARQYVALYEKAARIRTSIP
jgi:starch synthase